MAPTSEAYSSGNPRLEWGQMLEWQETKDDATYRGGYSVALSIVVLAFAGILSLMAVLKSPGAMATTRIPAAGC